MRGWRKERWLDTTDTVGRPVRITTGLTVNEHNLYVVGLGITAIGPVSVVSPTAVLTLDDGSTLFGNIHSSLTDLFKQGGGA